VSVRTVQGEAPDRHVPPSMIVIGLLLVGAFLGLAALTVSAVTNGQAASVPAQGSELPLPSDLDVIDHHATCGSEACDGQGLVVHWEGLDPSTAIVRLVDHFEANGWHETPTCAADSRCAAYDDLRVMAKPWSEVGPGVGAVMRASLDARGLDQSGFVYLKVTRCGILDEC
jgi:hypothetical protein